MFARVSKTPAVQALARRLERGGALSCAGVATPAQPFLAAVLHRIFPGRPIVVVTDGLKTQESIQQDLETWLASKAEARSPKLEASIPQPLFYPAWEVLPHEGRLPHLDVISDRLQTLMALAAQSEISNLKSAIIVANVTALLQRTFPPEELRRRTRTLARGERADPVD